MNQRAPMPLPEQHFYWSSSPNSLEWVIFALLLVVILLLIALLALALTRRMRFRGRRHFEHRLHGPPGPRGPGGGGPWGRPDPLSIARMRYARGEIGRDEYVQLTQDLGGGEPGVEPLTPPA
jgi:hypothetical protein